VLRLSRKPHALGGTVQIPGDDVPADAPAGQMIERRKPARQCVRMFVPTADRSAPRGRQSSAVSQHRAEHSTVPVDACR
jgi:hypothetical protein